MDRFTSRPSWPTLPPAETLLRIGAFAALFAAAGGLAIPSHQVGSSLLALVVVLAALLLPESRPPLHGAALAPARDRYHV